MTNLSKWFLILLLFNLGQVSCKQAHADIKDPRLMKITVSALTQAIKLTPITSPKNFALISRANQSHLGKLAYEKYTLLWKKNPASAYTNFYRALSADAYWWYATNPLLDGNLPIGSVQSQALVVAADKSFAKAIALRPNDPNINKAYGYFKFYRRMDMTTGLAMLKKAELLSPNDPQIHSMLGDIYSNLSVATYDSKMAETELRYAVSLDPKYASPHKLLANLFIDLKKSNEAQRELNMYISLAPLGTASSSIVQSMKTQIAQLSQSQ